MSAVNVERVLESMQRCYRCGAALLFSARARGDGLCGPCVRGEPMWSPYVHYQSKAWFVGFVNGEYVEGPLEEFIVVDDAVVDEYRQAVKLFGASE